MDALVTAWQRSDQLREDAALRVWLLRIATRHALSRRRRRRSMQPIDADLPLAAPRSTQPSSDRLVVAEAMAALPPRMRAAVALHHVSGLTVPEAAEALGTSENTVKSQLREGMARLRTALADPEPAITPARTQSHA